MNQVFQRALAALRLLAGVGPWAPDFAAAVVGEDGKYRGGGIDIESLAPPPPSEEDRKSAVDLSKQPAEKLFRLLAHELHREEIRPEEKRLGVSDFQTMAGFECDSQLMLLGQAAAEIGEEVKIYHQNVTGTAGLYWLLHEFPEEKSWAWLIAVSMDRLMRMVGHHFSRLSVLAVNDVKGCLNPSFRSILMNGVSMWRKLHGDYIALLWNGIAFGVLGDVTSWRAIEDDSDVPEAGPGGPPPNVSWSENLIFGNMYVASVHKFIEEHAKDLLQGAHIELQQLQRTGKTKPAQTGEEWRRHEDGVYSSFDFLRRQVFSGWDIDKGLLRGLLRYVMKPGIGDSAPVSVIDWGAGGGRYSEWLNDTGLVSAIAVDATVAVNDITGSSVLHVDPAAGSADALLWRTFDWALCLDVLPHVPAERANDLLRRLRQHARLGVIISCPGSSEVCGAGDIGAFIKRVEREADLQFDAVATESVKAGCELPRVADGLTVFRTREVSK